MTHLLAIDFGGTRIRAGWFDADLTLLNRAETPSRVDESVNAVIDRIITTARQVVPHGKSPAAIGISAPGPLDAQQGVILHADTLPGWQNVPLAARIQSAFDGAPTVMQNDANLAALAEYQFGAGQGCDPLVYLTISTGIGGGVVSNGTLVTGWRGFAIEPGHMRLILADDTIWKLQDLASGTAIGDWAQRHLATDNRESSLHQADAITGKIVGEAALAGDPVAREIVTQAGRWLGLGLVNILHMTHPQRIVLGGSVTQLGDLLLDPARDIIREHVMHDGFYTEDMLHIASLGDDVCLYGAADYARQSLS